MNKQQIELLAKKLTIGESINITRHNWNIVQLLVKAIVSGEAHIISKNFFITYRRNSDLDLSKLESWSTYENCVDITFSMNQKNEQEKAVICSASIWDGFSSDGRRSNPRFVVELLLPTNFLINIEGYVERNFDKKLEKLHEEYLEQQKQDWINAKTVHLLNVKDEVNT